MKTKMPGKISFPLPDGKTESIDDKVFCMMVRALIDVIAGRQGKRYKVAIEAARDALVTKGLLGKKSDPRRSVFLDRDRRQKLTATGFESLSKHEKSFLLLACRHVWCTEKNLSAPQLRALLALARSNAERARKGQKVAGAFDAQGQRHSGADASNYLAGSLRGTSSEFANWLGLTQSQEFLNSFVGDYFVLRRLANASKLIVAYMIVTQPDEQLPAEFVTRARVADAATASQDHVRGFLYIAPQQQTIFAIGIYAGTSQMRSSNLEPRPKPVENPSRWPSDLAGLRLGLSRTHRKPIAYRMWCSRLNSATKDTDWSKYTGVYDLAEQRGTMRIVNDKQFRSKHRTAAQRFFEGKILGFQEILRHLGTEGYVTLDAGDGDW